MTASLEKSSIHVEGTDDVHSIKQLLARHAISYFDDSQSLNLPEVNDVGDVQSLLAGMETGVKVSNGRAIGFVLDADTSLEDRWASIRARLSNVDVTTPDTPPPSGFLGTSSRFRARVGVWLMPDNSIAGTLEDFIASLIDDDDLLILHATTATATARSLGATFTKAKEKKALLHTWLAWQSDPGLPYGSAIRAKFFRHDSDVALAFVNWFRMLFSLDATTASP